MSIIDREAKRVNVSLDVLRAILAELDGADGIDDRLAELDAALVKHLKEKGCERRELSKEARDAWHELEDLDSRLLELKMSIREQIEAEGLEVFPKGLELPTGRVIGEEA